MTKVYYSKITEYSEEKFSDVAKKLLRKIVDEKNIKLNKKLPLKVHFGEHGNTTYVKAKVFDGIIDYLEENSIEGVFLETNVLYRGRRTTKTDHLKLALEHGFTKLPLVIADGERGEAFNNIEINKKHFKSCKIGKEFENYNQMLVISHFKGHIAAGFGGAIKQLAMGCSSRGGKSDQHADTKPEIDTNKCIKCSMCSKECPVEAITINDEKQFIDKDICVGCVACMEICPKHAIKKDLFESKGELFIEKMTEYAYAACKDKEVIYITFAYDMTEYCDCWGQKMEKVTNDVGIFASIDPVAIDKACYDMVIKNGHDFGGTRQLSYGEEIGLGSTDYEIIEVDY